MSGANTLDDQLRNALDDMIALAVGAKQSLDCAEIQMRSMARTERDAIVIGEIAAARHDVARLHKRLSKMHPNRRTP